MMKLFFLKRKMTKDLKSYNRSKRFECYTDLKSFVLLCAYENLEEVLQYKALLSADQKVVQIICFYSGKEKEKPAVLDGVHLWTIKQLDFFGLIPQQIVDKFITYKADVYMNLTLKQNLIFEHFLMQVKPNYWVGFRNGNVDLGDLILESNDATTYMNLVEQLHFYLKTIRTK